jgi:hypothetical protein
VDHAVGVEGDCSAPRHRRLTFAAKATAATPPGQCCDHVCRLRDDFCWGNVRLAQSRLSLARLTVRSPALESD